MSTGLSRLICLFFFVHFRAPIQRLPVLRATHPHEIYVRIATTLTWNQLRHVLKMSGNLFSGSKAVLFSRTVNAAKHDRIVQELLLEMDPMAGDSTQLVWMPPKIPSGVTPEELTMDELKDYLNLWKLPTSGSKMELVERFKKYQEDALVGRKERASSQAKHEDDRFVLIVSSI